MTSTQNTTAAEVTRVVDRHLAAYGETDLARRRGLVEQTYAEDAHVFEPPLDANGRDAIDGLIGALQAQFPGHSFRRTTAVDTHHNIARYGWALDAPDGSVALTGIDVVVLNDALHLVRVVGFFGEPPALG